jgi:hypothetical protein
VGNDLHVVDVLIAIKEVQQTACRPQRNGAAAGAGDEVHVAARDFTGIGVCGAGTDRQGRRGKGSTDRYGATLDQVPTVNSCPGLISRVLVVHVPGFPSLSVDY